MPRVWLLAIGPVLLLVLLVAGLGTALSREARLEELRAPDIAEDLETWHHRGPGRTYGYAGMELDVRWLAGRGLVVSHDPIGPGGAAPALRDVVQRAPMARDLWLDFKRLDRATAVAAAAELAALVESRGIAGRCWVEAADLEALAHLRAAVPGLRPIARVSPWQRLRPLPGYLAFLGDLLRHRISAVALPNGAVTPGLAARFEPLRLMVFTVNSPVERERLRRLGVEVILTDRLAPE